MLACIVGAMTEHNAVVKRILDDALDEALEYLSAAERTEAFCVNQIRYFFECVAASTVEFINAQYRLGM